MDIKVFVTGAGGFIGKAVTLRLLEQGYGVTAFVRNTHHISFDHPNLRWHFGDLRNKESILKGIKDIDIVVHLAAAKADEEESYESNVVGTRNLLEVCRVNKIRGIVNVSTISTKLKKKGIYAKTKQEADDIIMKQSDIPVVTIKPSIVYGDIKSGIFGTLIKVTRLPIVVIIGPGIFTSRPIHVDDLAFAIQKIVSRPISTHKVYDIGGPDNVSFNELVHRIAKKVNKRDVKLVHIPVFFGLCIARFLKLILKKPPITLSNVLAMDQEAIVTAQVFENEYNFHPRSLTLGLEEINLQHEYPISESHALLDYIFSLSGVPVSNYQVKIYEQVLDQQNIGNHTVSEWILRNKLYLGGLDAMSRIFYPKGIFQKKLSIATTIFECSPLSSEWLLPKKNNILTMFLKLSYLGFRSLIKIGVGIVIACIPGIIKKNA